MMRLRRCKIRSSIPLVLLFLLNIIFILLYLGPSHPKMQDAMLSQPALPEIQTVVTKIVQPHHGTDPVPVFDTQVGLTPSNISTTKIKNSELHPTQHRPQFDKNSVSIVAQPAKNPAVHRPMTGSNETNKMEIYNDWGSNNSENENLDHARKQLTFNRKAMLIAGKPPKHPVEIVIGIPTVMRITSHYLSSTLKHLVDYLSHNETKQCHIVVFSADFNESENQKIAQFIKTKFKKEIDAGLIEVIKPDKTYYPKLTGLPSLWKDKPDRIFWRSKQCVDYSLLFAYCRYLGKYYLQLEDDITVAPGYFNQIKNFIQAQGSTNWSNLEFGTTGFIGMLFKTKDLGRLALFVKMYYWVFPVDILFRHFNDVHLSGNKAHDVYSPPLFHHIGIESSLKGQTRKLNNGASKNKKTYVNNRLYKDANNPQSFISTNIEVFDGYTIDGPYRSANIGFFWGKDIKVSDFVLIEFLQELTLLRVVIDTGSIFAPNDLIGDGKLETAGALKDGGCDKKKLTLLKSAKTGGKIKASAQIFGGIPAVKCILFTITNLNKDNNGKSRWLLIREIAVWSH